MKLLHGHISPETAYVIDDYPYGFRLRCKIRYWIEYRPKMGSRMVSQTTNPKRDFESWNKPKYGIYHEMLFLTLNELDGHVGCVAINRFGDEKEIVAFRNQWKDQLFPEHVDKLDKGELYSRKLNEKYRLMYAKQTNSENV